MFMMKKHKCKSEDEFMKFYGENLLIFHMIEYCEVMNPDSIASKVINVENAVDYFNYASICYEDDGQFNKDLNKMKEIIEESLAAPVEAPLNTGYSNDEAKIVFEKEL